MTARTIRSGWAFLLGIAFALLPAFGPFAAVLLLFSRGWGLQRRDLLWAGAAAVLALPSLATGDAMAALTAVATVAGPWIVFRTFHRMKWTASPEQRPGQVVLGLLVGFTIAIVAGLLRAVAAVDLESAFTIPQAITWTGSPALYGHSVLVMGGLIALLARGQPRVASTAMALAAAGILFSGSREAAIGWVVLAILQILVRDADSRRPHVAEAILLGLMLLVAAGLAPLLGWGRVGFLVAPDAPGDAGAAGNLLIGTEVPGGDWWDDRWVEVSSSEVVLEGQALTAYAVRKRGAEGWQRLQQVVRLAPGTTYTLSGWIQAPAEGVPGFHGWSPLPDDAGLVLTSALRDGRWRAQLTGPGELLGAEEIGRDGAWRRVAVTFRYADDAAATTWFVGFAPDTRPIEGVTSRVAGLQLEVAEEAGPYTPGPATGGLSFLVARAPLWEVAADAILQRPLFGWGDGAFSSVYLEARPGQDRIQIAPAHPHNQFLLTLFERGFVGLIGLSLLLVALFGLTVRYRDLGFLSVALVVLLANAFDSTLLYGGVLYPLAAVAGWRSARRGPRRSAGAEGARQATVRVALAGADVGAALLALLSAQRIALWFGVHPEAPPSVALVGALLLWPAFSWREGLYPGYGLTPAQELKKQTTAAAYAGLLFAAGTILFADALAVPLATLLVFVALTFVILPVTRAATKEILHAMRLWGRPVVILGAGATGHRVARGLVRTPMDGLHPIALFDDDPSLRSRRVHGMRVRGTLDEAYAFSARHHVHHAIVAIPSLDTERLDGLINGSGKVFRRVQFVPNLGSIPTDDVIASDLDGLLALEVRNGLFAPGNRIVKRIVDVAATTVGGILISPLLVALWAWVRLDSSGGAFYRSERVGQDGRVFRCLKFRTMHVDAEERLTHMLDEDPVVRREYETWHKLSADPRITRAGRFLRTTSLDELPQLWNVLRGEMSLVGPRPYLAREVPDIGPYAPIIFQAKPGVTGHWQVNGRSEVTFVERLLMEAHYVRNWSIWWDVILLVRTPVAVMRSGGKGK